MPNTTSTLPRDRRLWQGAALFLASLLVFFLSSIILYLLYAYWRRDDPQSMAMLPASFVVSTVCLLAISGLVHYATRLVRRDRLLATAAALGGSALLAIGFMLVQAFALWQMLESPEMRSGLSRGVGGMVVVLAVLHALHVMGGVISLAIVAVRSFQGRYDHERHGAVDFAAAYWHFLDAVWLLMLLAFWGTTGGFQI